MARAPRIQYPGALYHVTTRGVRRSTIYVDERDFLTWQDRLATTVERFNFSVHAFCQMTNHYHLLVETVEGNLSDGMHYLNSTYAQTFNFRHKLTGHVLQGRFNAVPVKKDAQLLEVARYIVQNPVRARLVDHPEAWRWSSHGPLCGLAPPLPWLSTAWLLAMFDNDNIAHAISRYRQFVGRELAADPLAERVEHGAVDPSRKRQAMSLAEYQKQYPDRDEAMARAYFSTVYRMRDISTYFGVSTKTVSRAVHRFETGLKAELVSLSGSDPTVDTSSAVEAASSVGINAAKAV